MSRVKKPDISRGKQQRPVKKSLENYRDTHFTKQEYEALVNKFRVLTKENTAARAEKLDRVQFRDVLQTEFSMTDDMLMDRILRAFDKDNDSCVSLSEWLNGLSVFLRGSLSEKTAFCFDVYDLNGDTYISREEMFHLLKPCLLKQPSEEDPDEGIKDLVETTLKTFDYDHDGRISFKDYQQGVVAEPLLLESFGTCLPDAQVSESFLAKFSEQAANSETYKTSIKYK